MLVNLEQSEKARSPMAVTVLGISALPDTFVASIKIPFTITYEFSFLLLSSHFVQLKAPAPIKVTLSGMVTLVIPEQSKKA